MTLILKNEAIDLILSTAAEGGSTYWCSAARPIVNGKRDENGWVTHESGLFKNCINWIATIKKHGVAYCDYEGFSYEEAEEKNWHVLTRKMITDGCKKIDKYPEIKRRLQHENYDAADADVFLQMCLFGKVIYG
jgi:hypothetical protein